MQSLNNWTAAIESGKQIHAVYLDYAKAFDTVSHRKLEYKLQKYGFGGNLLRWLSAFLKDRYQSVCVDGTPIRKVTCFKRCATRHGLGASSIYNLC